MIKFENKKILVFDIEVAAYDFETHYDEETKAYLLKYADTDAEKENAILNLVFNPFTSFTVAIGVLDFNKNEGCVYLNAGKNLSDNIISPFDKIKYVCDNEKAILERFWNFLEIKKYDYFITFNGRDFDCPYLILRSAVLGIKPTVNLMKSNDFNFNSYHIDLIKELTFYRHSTGAKRKFSLDFYCKQFGIKSPKADGVSGDKVGELYKNNEFQKIADYCIGDVIAEAELFKKWNETLNI